MKTIKRNSEIKRVSDKEAMHLVKFGWEYCPKNLWKEGKNKKPVNDLNTETDAMSDKKKRKLRKENKRKKYETK
jgi:hypothetical protein